MQKKVICLVVTLMLSSALLSGCSLFGTGSGDDTAGGTTVENPQKEYNDKVLSTMQEISSYKDIFENCSNKKIKKKYEKISYNAGALTVEFQTNQLSTEEIEDGMKKMDAYKEKCDKLLEKIGITPSPAA